VARDLYLYTTAGLVRNEHELIDHGAQAVAGLVPLAIAGIQRFAQAVDLGRVGVGNTWMDGYERCRVDIGELSGQVVALGCGGCHKLADFGKFGSAVGDCAGEAGETLVGLVEASL